MNELCGLYARFILDTGLLKQCTLLFGPAYKGIPLVTGIAMSLAQAGRNVPFAFNRKAAKRHGEGGIMIGTPVEGQNVLIVDDVITAGTAINAAIRVVRKAGGTPSGILIALDRMERGKGGLSAIQEVSQRHKIPVHALATLDNLFAYVKDSPDLQQHTQAVQQYRADYGVGQQTLAR